MAKQILVILSDAQSRQLIEKFAEKYFQQLPTPSKVQVTVEGVTNLGLMVLITAFAVGIGDAAMADEMSHGLEFIQQRLYCNTDNCYDAWLHLSSQIEAHSKCLYDFSGNASSSLVEIFNFSWKCIQFAIVISKGQAVLEGSSLNGIYQELLIWLPMRATPRLIDCWAKELTL